MVFGIWISEYYCTKLLADTSSDIKKTFCTIISGAGLLAPDTVPKLRVELDGITHLHVVSTVKDMESSGDLGDRYPLPKPTNNEAKMQQLVSNAGAATNAASTRRY